MARFAECFPSDIKTDSRWNLRCAEKGETIDDRDILRTQPHLFVSVPLQRIIRKSNRPEEARRCDLTIKVVELVLKARTGLKEIESYQGEGAAVTSSTAITIVRTLRCLIDDPPFEWVINFETLD